jgi:hypothetical protein
VAFDKVLFHIVPVAQIGFTEERYLFSRYFTNPVLAAFNFFHRSN